MPTDGRLHRKGAPFEMMIITDCLLGVYVVLEKRMRDVTTCSDLMGQEAWTGCVSKDLPEDDFL